MTIPRGFDTALQLPSVLVALAGALERADLDPARAEADADVVDMWAEAEPEVRACILLSAAFGAGRGPAPTVPAGMHRYVAGYVEDFHRYAAIFGADQSEAFHGPAFPAMPLPGQAGALASSLGFDRDDLPISIGVALVLLAAGRTTAAGPEAPVEAEPMPVFVIKGKDSLAPAAVDAYFTLCLAQGLTGQAAEVADAAREIREWQARNPHLVKAPNHPHVPVK